MERLEAKKKEIILTLLLTTESADHVEDLNTSLELFIFITKYSFLLTDTSPENNFLKRHFPNHVASSTPNSNGARYLDPKYSRWLSTDPALSSYVERNYEGPSGGIYNSVNLNLYHYGENNPIKYVDSDGREDKSSISMNFKKSTQTLTVTVNIVNPEVCTEKQKFSMPYKFTGNEKKTFTIKLTNNVKTPEQRGNIPVKFRNYYYFPEDFPNGTWNVTDWGFNDKNFDIGWYIATDAGRMVDTYQKNDEGVWEKTDTQVYDTGYLLHGSDGDGNRTGDNNEDYSTWGCGRGDNFDILTVIFYIKLVKVLEGTKTLQVED